ncbi:hypothetical protein RUND412_007180 [Rhizina undulata]
MERRTGSIPTKRMLQRRGSYSSVTSNEGGVAVSGSNGMMERRTSLLNHRFRSEKSPREGRYWESDDEEDAGVGIGGVGSTRSTASRRSLKMTLRSPPESPSRGKKGKRKFSGNILSRGPLRGVSAPDLRIRRELSVDSDFSSMSRAPPVPPLPQGVPISRVTTRDGYADSVVSFASELESIAEDDRTNGSTSAVRRRKHVGKVPGNEGVRVEETVIRGQIPATPDSHSGGSRRTEMSINNGLVPPTPPSSNGGLRVRSRPSSSSSACSALGSQVIKGTNNSSSARTHYGPTSRPTIHNPPPRSISPGKSALKRPSTPEHKNPDTSYSASSSIAHLLDKEKPKKPRVSFSSDDSVAVGYDATSRPRLWDLDGDAPGGVKISGIPKLPTFASIGKRAWEEEKAKMREDSVLVEVDGNESSSTREDMVEFDWERKRKEISTQITVELVPPTSPVETENGGCFVDPNEPEVPTLRVIESNPAEKRNMELVTGFMDSPIEKRAETTTEETGTAPVEYPSDDESGASIYSDAVEEFDPLGSAEGGGVVLNPSPATGKALPNIMEMIANGNPNPPMETPENKESELPKEEPLTAEPSSAEILPFHEVQDECIVTPPSPSPEQDQSTVMGLLAPFHPPQETFITLPPTPPPMPQPQITSPPLDTLQRTPSASSAESKTSVSSYKRINPRPVKSNSGLRTSMRTSTPPSEPNPSRHSLKQTLLSQPPPPSPLKPPFRTLSKRSTTSSSDDAAKSQVRNRGEIFRKSSSSNEARPATATAASTSTTHATGAFSLPLGVTKRGLLRRNSGKDGHEKPPASFKMPKVGRNGSLIRKKRDGSVTPSAGSEQAPSAASSIHGPAPSLSATEYPPVPPVPADARDKDAREGGRRWRRPSLRRKKKGSPEGGSLTGSAENGSEGRSAENESEGKSGDTSPLGIGIAVSPGVGGVVNVGEKRGGEAGEVVVEGGVGMVGAGATGKKKRFRALRRLFGMDD